MRLDGTDSVPILHNPGKLSEENYANFYFPDCGSERLFSEVGIATLAILREVGAETVMPPGYRCCGYPQTAAGLYDRGRQIISENRILFHRIAITLKLHGYQDSSDLLRNPYGSTLPEK
ncbi:MAG: (Fe-S)-binding protein [gamma proteobacterium symbiont of Ctena orbiculata]|nr:(Fe-S)-binding protein [Candidatus Thiodiazotropha sp. (ex Codakia orbicularis)]MBT3044551.1 (Fe-S)-binding protein [Candidatus Thiodiazotropha sp. (ex Codakia orbicularis)]